MKKAYIIPSLVVVRLAMTRPIAGSLDPLGATFYDDDATTDALVKGNDPISDKDIWDDVW